jgi:uncharacterized protein (DUF2141 family)
VTVKNIRPGHGKVLIAVFQRNNFSLDEMPKYYQVLDGSMPEMTVCFDKLPPGKYALGSYQDTNNNLILDKNRLGIPTESFGFSNNPSAKWRKPSFDDASVDYPQYPNNHIINLKFWRDY